MNKNQKKFAVGALLIVGAIVYLITAGISKSSLYYLTVDEAIAKGTEIYGKGVRVEGKVVSGSIVKNSATQEISFTMTENPKPIDPKDEKTMPVKPISTGAAVHVTYKGVVPDLFKDDAKVVVEGSFSQNGNFAANTLMTSCPSKYEAIKSKQEGNAGSASM